MRFDWAKFVEVAEHLADGAVEIRDPDACYRSSGSAGLITAHSAWQRISSSGQMASIAREEAHTGTSRKT